MVVAADSYSYVLISIKIPVLYVRVWVYTCHTYITLASVTDY